MNLATHRFTISTMAVSACAMVALVAAEPAQAQSAAPSVQRIEIVGKRIAQPAVQRIEIIGQRPHSERVAVGSHKAPAL